MSDAASTTRVEWLDGEALLFDAVAQKLFRVDEASAHAHESAAQTDCGAVSAAPRPPRYADVSACFRLGGAICGIKVADAALMQTLDQIFGALRVDLQPCDLVLDLDTPAARADPIAAAISVKADILDAWLAHHPQAMAFHAAALGCGAGATILAGGSGRGKSTLAALWHAQNCPLIADDVVLLSEGDTTARGFATSFATKAASWPVLARVYPELEHAPEVIRPDGKAVRYLRPRATLDSAPIDRILFPHFKPGAAFSATPMKRATALVQLLAEGRNDAQKLSLCAFETLCGILRSSDVLTLEYGESRDAAVQLERMLHRL